MLTDQELKKLRTNWTRQQARLANEVVEIEKELARLKEKKVNPAFVQQKSDRLDTILKTVNDADDLIHILVMENIELKVNLAVMNHRYMQALDDSIKELSFMVSKPLNDLKPESQRIANEISKKS